MGGLGFGFWFLVSSFQALKKGVTSKWASGGGRGGPPGRGGGVLRGHASGGLFGPRPC